MKHLYRRASALAVGALLGGAVVVAPGLSGPVSAQVAGPCVQVSATSSLEPVGAMDSIGDTVFGALAFTDEFAAVDTITGATLDTVPVGTFPDGVSLAGGKAYVANATDDSVSVVDLATFTVVATITGLTNPIGPATANGKVYVAASGGLQVIDPATDTVIDTIAGVGGYPYEVNGSIWLLSGSTVWVVDTATDTITDTFSTSGSLGVGLAAYGGRVYITNAISSDVSVIDEVTHVELAVVPVGGNPRDAAPFDGWILVTASDPGILQAIDPATLAVVDLIDFGDEDAVDRLQPVGSRVFISGFPGSNVIEACAAPVTTTTAAAAEAATVTPAFTG